MGMMTRTRTKMEIRIKLALTVSGLRISFYVSSHSYVSIGTYSNVVLRVIVAVFPTK